MTDPIRQAQSGSLPQRRNLVTEIPGPASRELMARRDRAVARGVSTMLPIFVTDEIGRAHV